jgi:hypothetical protein
MTRPKQMCAAVLLAAVVSALPAHADCVLPPPPSKIPDGASATEQQMISAMQTLKEYDGDVNVYLKCLEFEERQNRLSPGEHTRQHNVAVSQEEKVAGQFNEQVKVFKSKHT